MLQDWPAQSLDMNIIEHVWDKMKEEAWKMKPKNLDGPWESCKTSFLAIPDDFINKLYESMPRRMDAVILAHNINCFSQGTLILCSDVIDVIVAFCLFKIKCNMYVSFTVHYFCM